jgi:CheY-like chemotaxis protein
MAYVACSDGNEALQLLANCLPATVLLDVALTGRYAFDVIKFVRSQPRGGEVRILLLTSSFRRGSFVAKATELHGANDSIDGVVLSGMENEEFRRFLTTAISASASQGPPAEPSTLGEKAVESTPTQWNQASTLAKVIAADIVLRYQDLLEESARTGVLGKALVEGLAKGRLLFSARMGEDFARNYDFVGAALAACLQGGSSNPSYDADE